MSSVPRRRRAAAAVARGAAAALSLALLACAHAPRMGHPVQVSEVLALSLHGVPPDEIIAKMNRGGLVYDLSDAQYAELRKQGVTPQVIGYMRSTWTQALAKFPKLANDANKSCLYLGHDGYWYGGGPHGFHPDC